MIICLAFDLHPLFVLASLCHSTALFAALPNCRFCRFIKIRAMASNVLGFLSDKNILVTGSTGFLGKIFIEKILRSQPGISSIFVLLRANDAESAKIRFKTEVLKLELFRTLREQHGDSFESFIFQKVVPVVGDIATDHNLGIYTESSRELLWENLDAIVHMAANTVFDYRYDVSLNVNTKGAMNIVEFAKRCRKLQILVHVSTAGIGASVDCTVDVLEKAYEGFIGAVERILEARESSDAAKTLTTDAAIENFKQLGLIRVAHDRAEQLVESVRQRFGSEFGFG